LAETQRTEEGIIVNLKIGELFEPGKTTLKPNIIDEITRIGDILADYPQDRVIVVGHTDNNGSDEEAERLSENQAKAVRTQLLICSIPEKNIMAIGMGKSQPIAPNGTPDGQAQNRRIEIKITAK
jgi:outer membrane protein OmpA-like peptidoglycan-associated protein